MALSAMAQSMSSEAKEAQKVTFKCIYKYSVQLDDGVSNVETIAKVVANSCQKENIQFSEIFTSGVDLSPAGKQDIFDEIFRKNIEVASYYILTNRAAKK